MRKLFEDTVEHSSLFKLLWQFTWLKFFCKNLNLSVGDGTRLQISEVSFRHADAVQQHYNLSVEKALTEGAASNHVQRQIWSFKFNLTLSQLNFYGSFHVLLLHQYTFGTCNSNLKGTSLCISKFSSCLLGSFLINVANSISKAEIFTLYVR